MLLSLACLPKDASRLTEEPVVLSTWVAEESAAAVSLGVEGGAVRATAGEVRRSVPMERVQMESWIRRDWRWSLQPRELLLLGLPGLGAGLLLAGVDAAIPAKDGEAAFGAAGLAGAGLAGVGLAPLGVLGVRSLLVMDTRVGAGPPLERPAGAAREVFVQAGGYTGPVQVRVVAERTAWEGSGELVFAEGAATDLSGMPYLPDTARPGVPVFSQEGRAVLVAQPLEVYRQARAQALVSRDADFDTRSQVQPFDADYAWWHTPHRFRLEFQTYDVPQTRPMDNLLKALVGGAYADVKVEFRVNDQSLGCTPLLGDNLPPGVHAWGSLPVLLVNIARADEWQIVAWDEDFTDSEMMYEGQLQFGLPPETGTDGLTWRLTELKASPLPRSGWRGCINGT